MLVSFALAALPLLAAAAPLSKRDGYNAQIRFDGDSNKCLAVAEGYVADGSNVYTAPCDDPNTLQGWDIFVGSNQYVALHGTQLCLDSGPDGFDTNFVQVTVRTCASTPTQSQMWYLTDDKHIAVQGGTTCLDLADGGDKVQTYQCGGANQVWDVGSAYSAPTGGLSAYMASTMTASAAVPACTP